MALEGSFRRVAEASMEDNKKMHNADFLVEQLSLVVANACLSNNDMELQACLQALQVSHISCKKGLPSTLAFTALLFVPMHTYRDSIKVAGEQQMIACLVILNLHLDSKHGCHSSPR